MYSVVNPSVIVTTATPHYGIDRLAPVYELHTHRIVARTNQ